MKKTFMMLIVALIFILSGCEEERIIDITGNDELIVYIGSNEETIVSNLSVSGLGSNENYEINADLRDVRINIPGTYDIVYSVTINESVIYREYSTITITDTPLTDYPEINYTQDLVHVIGHPVPDYSDLVTVSDKTYGSLTDSLEIDDSSVNYNTIGSYEVSYSVTNSDGFTSNKNIMVHVVDNNTLSPLPDRFFIVEQNNKFGIKDEQNVTILPTQYDNIEYLNDNVLKLYVEDVPYYYDYNTDTYITTNHEIFNFSNGLATTQNIIGYYGYVTRDFELEIPFTYDQASTFTRGLAKVTVSGLQGLIDPNNELVLPIIYSNIQSFKDGFIVQQDNQTLILSDRGATRFNCHTFNQLPIIINNETYYIFSIDNTIGLVDEDFNVIIDPTATDIYNVGTTIVAESNLGTFNMFNPVTNNTYTNVYEYNILGDYIFYQTDQGSGILDFQTLEEIIPPTFVSITMLENDLFLVRDADYNYGILNHLNKVIVPIAYSSFRTLNNGLYIMTDGSGSTLVSRDGNLISNVYDGIQEFNEGYAIVEKDGLYGLIVEDGTEVLRPTYNNILPVTEGLIYTYNSDIPNDSAWGVLNLNMQVVVPNSYASIGPLRDGLFAVIKDYSDETSSGYLNASGYIALPLEYKETTTLEEGYGIVTLPNDTKRVIDQFGDFIHTDSFYNIKEGSNGYFTIQTSEALNSHCLMNSDGIIVTPCIYQYITPYVDDVATITTSDGVNYLTKDGTLLLDDSVNYADPFTDGFGLFINREYKSNIIDNQGNIIFEDLFSAKILNKEYIAIKDLETLLYGIYDTNGNMIKDHSYFTIEPFKEGFSVACINSHKQCGVIDEDANIRIPFIYDLVSIKEEGYLFRYEGLLYDIELIDDTLIKTCSTSSIITYVYGTQNNLYINDTHIGTFDYEDFIPDGLYLDVYSEDYIGLASIKGDILISPLYEGYQYRPNRDYQYITTGGLLGVIDNFDTVIIPELYDLIYPINNEYFIVVQGEYYGVFDIEGNMIIPTMYQSITFKIK